MKTWAQLTEKGWKHITEETAEACGLLGEKAYTFAYVDHDYAGGGCSYTAGMDTPESILTLLEDGIAYDLDNGVETIWPDDVASHAAIEMSSYAQDDGETLFVVVAKALGRVAPIGSCAS